MPRTSRYYWDAGNLEKCQKHGVTVSEIEHTLDTDPFIVPDYEPSEHEDRNIAVGFNRSGRPVLVVFTIRQVGDQEVVRPLSARYMHRKEIERYERLWR
jgi:uncharacterized DUF497 family protein